ncbi:MAG: flagellar assembly peptidoglycan hydrolase FlgJ, partial [Pseudomonadota bacterium]
PNAPTVHTPGTTAASAAPEKTDGSRFDTPLDFVRAIWPLAQQAAATLRVSPRMIVAQAALETGWGRHGIRHADGTQANNLFGIKAGGGWGGPSVDVPTTEVLGGIARKVVAAFRSYGSLAESVADYTRLILTSPRYRAALNTGGDGVAFARALQDGGYATDPAYAAKVLSIADGDTLTTALERLKKSR